MPAAKHLDTHAAWTAAQQERRRCARPGCGNERPAEGGSGGRGPTSELCFGCALEAELFDRETRWAAARS
jgi:hypothetical protein